MRSISKITFLFSLFLTTATPSFAQYVVGDWDNNGKSDVAVAIVYRSGDANIPYIGTDWLVRRDNATPVFYHFPGVAADALVTGRYFSDGKIYPGIVNVVNASTPLLWTIKNPQNSQVSLYYGYPGDEVMNQGDLDCDGVTDFAVARTGTGALASFKFWYVALSSSGGAIIEKLFGLKDDVPFTADMDGDGCSEMVVLRPGFWFWYSTKLFGSAVTQVQWGLQGDYPLTPQDMNGDGNADYIISRISGSQQQVYVRYSDNSNTSTTYNIPSTAIPMTGRFVSSSQSSLAFWNRSTGLLSFVQGDNSLSSVAFGISVNAVVRPDGTVVQPTQTARVPETGTGSTGGGSSGGDSGGGNDGPPSAGLSAVCSTIVPFSAGSLWKPSSQDTNDAREGRPVILYNRNIPTGYSCLKVYAKNGEAISQLGVYEYSGRYGGRWYTGRGCGDLKTGSQIASTAQSKTGSVSVYVQRQPGVCVGPFDPRNRNGSLA